MHVYNLLFYYILVKKEYFKDHFPDIWKMVEAVKIKTMKEVFEEIMHKHTKLIGANLELCDFDKAAEEIANLYTKKLFNARIDEAKNNPERVQELKALRDIMGGIK